MLYSIVWHGSTLTNLLPCFTTATKYQYYY